jgi:hypothetical protein
MKFLTLVLVAAAATAPVPSVEAIGLARQIMQAQHREALVRETFGKQLRAAMPICKSDAKCQADLDRAIANATREIAHEQAENVAQLLARKLTIAQMRTALKFYTSPEGQTFVAAQEGMTDELAQIGHASSVYAQRSISRNFCPSHPEVCVNDLGRHPATAPKS